MDACDKCQLDGETVDKKDGETSKVRKEELSQCFSTPSVASF